MQSEKPIIVLQVSSPATCWIMSHQYTVTNIVKMKQTSPNSAGNSCIGTHAHMHFIRFSAHSRTMSWSKSGQLFCQDFISNSGQLPTKWQFGNENCQFQSFNYLNKRHAMPVQQNSDFIISGLSYQVSHCYSTYGSLKNSSTFRSNKIWCVFQVYSVIIDWC